MPEPLREHLRFLGSPGTTSFLHRYNRDETSSTSIWLHPILYREGSYYPPFRIVDQAHDPNGPDPSAGGANAFPIASRQLQAVFRWQMILISPIWNWRSTI